jgi:hypothetical protein
MSGQNNDDDMNDDNSVHGMESDAENAMESSTSQPSQRIDPRYASPSRSIYSQSSRSFPNSPLPSFPGTMMNSDVIKLAVLTYLFITFHA